MQTIKQYAEANNIQPNKLLNYLIPKYPKAGLSLGSQLPEDFAQYADEIAKIAEKVHEQSKAPAAASIGEGAITTVDEAVQSANYKLTEADRVTTQQTVDIQTTGSKLLGQATGVNAALQFMEGMVTGKQMVFNTVNELGMEQLEQSLEEINQSAFSLSNTASNCLGKQISLQERLQEKMKRLQENVAKMGAVTQSPR